MRKPNKKRISLGIAAAILLLALAFYAWYTKTRDAFGALSHAGA